MKKYIAPEMEIAKFAMADVVTTSGTDTPAPSPTNGLDNTNSAYTITGDRSEYIY